MTPEERALMERRLKELKLQKLKQQRAQMQAQAQPEPEAPAYDESNLTRDRLGMAAQGATLGFGDEITSGLSAVGRELGSWVGLADEGTVADRYNERQDRVRDEREAYREANPYEAMALEMGGGMLTGGLGAGRAAASIGVRTLGRNVMGSVARDRARREAVKAAPSWKRTAGILAGESALAGAGDRKSVVRERVCLYV